MTGASAPRPGASALPDGRLEEEATDEEEGRWWRQEHLVTKALFTRKGGERTRDGWKLGGREASLVGGGIDNGRSAGSNLS